MIYERQISKRMLEASTLGWHGNPISDVLAQPIRRRGPFHIFEGGGKLLRLSDSQSVLWKSTPHLGVLPSATVIRQDAKGGLANRFWRRPEPARRGTTPVPGRPGKLPPGDRHGPTRAASLRNESVGHAQPGACSVAAATTRSGRHPGAATPKPNPKG